MLGVCFFILCALSVLFGICTGHMPDLSNAVLDGASHAVELILSLAGMMALWCGIMNVFLEAGIIRRLSRVLSPVLRFVFPQTWKSGIAREEITASVSANLLGIGNAATPLALSAMSRMQEDNPHPDTATNDMVTLSVLATSSLDILPTTLIALRRSAGSAAPYAILLPVWITSAVCCLAAVLLCRAIPWAFPTRRKRHDS